MNKKLYLFFIVPILCSCHGNSASCETVLRNIENIKKQYNYEVPSYSHFILTTESTWGENKSLITEFYDKNQKFYHSYTIEEGILKSEVWNYVQNNSDGDTNIYYVVREQATGDSPVLINKTVYTDEAWKDREISFIRFRINNVHSNYLVSSTAVINNYLQDSKNKTLGLNSFNSSSFYINYSNMSDDGTLTTREIIEYRDSLFVEATTTNEKDITYSTKCVYRNFDILYPKYNK